MIDAPALPAQKVNRTISLVLDPEFAKELQGMSSEYDGYETAADNSKWVIAEKVNSMWPEHETARDENGVKVFETKKDFYMECSRVANIGLKKKRFSDSGETLRRWCETQETYNQWQDAYNFLNWLSFDHLYKAKKLYKDGKVRVPVLALAEAVRSGYTADEMKEHFDPTIPPHEYDIWKENINTLINAKLEFVKDLGVRKEIKKKLSDIDQSVRNEIEKERKAV